MSTATIERPAAAPTHLEVTAELARRHFWDFCQAVDPEFYLDDRWHLHDLCDTLEAFEKGELLDSDGKPYLKLIIQFPPRHGKSRTLKNFSAWVLGRDPSRPIITGSYNDELAQDFSKQTRNLIDQQRAGEEIVYSDVFPGIRIKPGDSAYKQWALVGRHFSYRGSGIGGTVTGKGGGWLIVDDPIKGADEAYSDLALDRVWQWYTGTWISRKESGAREIVCMTAWARGDLTGRLLATEPEKWFVFAREAWTEEQGMLCEQILSYSEYKNNEGLMDDAIFQANYHNRRIDIKGALYQNLQTYDDLPRDSNAILLSDRIVNYTDTADEGDDFLCSISAVIYLGVGYVIDIYYTKDPQEITEPETARRMASNNVRESIMESNNGGRGFSRNVERICRESGWAKTGFSWFHQSKNKRSRILTEATNVQNNLRFPADWRTRWPEYWRAMTEYQREGKNAHDDAPDATTGLAEQLGVRGFMTAQKTSRRPVTAGARGRKF